MKENNGMKTYPVAQVTRYNYWLYGTAGLIMLTIMSLGCITLSYIVSLRQNKPALAHCYAQQQEIKQAKQTLTQLQQKISEHASLGNEQSSLASIVRYLNDITTALDDETRLSTFEISDMQLQIVGQSSSINNALAFYTKLSESEQLNKIQLISMRPHNELIEFIINGQV